MADITWSNPHTGSSEAASNIEVLWITDSVFVTCWEDAAGTGFKANVYSDDGSHLHTQALFTYGTIKDNPIQLAKVRDNHWVLAFCEDVGFETVRMNHFEWTGSAITNHGEITAITAQQMRFPAVCNIGDDKIMLWARRFDVANAMQSRYCTYDGSSWTVNAATSVSPNHYSDLNRACMVAENKGILFWNDKETNFGRCHGFGNSSGGGTDIVAIDGTYEINYVGCCRLADNRVVMGCYNPDTQSGRLYAITLEDSENPNQPTVGAAYVFYAQRALNVTCACIDSTHFLVAYQDADDGSKGKTIYCTVDWDNRTITGSDAETFSSNYVGGGSNYGIGMDSNSEGIIALSYRDQDDNNYVKSIVGQEETEQNISLSVSELIDYLISITEINNLYALQEIDHLYSNVEQSVLFSDSEKEGLYTIKESSLYSATSLQEV